MRIRVCSGFSPSGRSQYGNRFLASFDRYWPAGTELLVYVEEMFAMPRGAERLLWSIPGATDFHVRHADNPDAHGRIPHDCWKPRERIAGYSFRTDAGKFWKQLLIPGAAADDEQLGKLDDGDILVWLDGDVETTARVPDWFIESLMVDPNGGPFDVAFLGREPKHSEIGFWAVTISPRTRLFLAQIAEMYTSDAVFQMTQYHSARVWDHVRRPLHMRERNLTRPGTFNHVWPYSVLARYMIHEKGALKFRKR